MLNSIRVVSINEKNICTMPHNTRAYDSVMFYIILDML